MNIVFATNNSNKIKEVQALLPSHIKLVSLEEIGCVEDIPETQDTIEGNAIQKADYIKTHYGLCLLYTSPSPRDRTRSRMPSSA